ncbi:MAG TPA: ATP-dependent DNA helicase [Nocardioidaceae bacterium]|nr:ATP-dependent DNA helicase [Nocardioidaceae bacterium]
MTVPERPPAIDAIDSPARLRELMQTPFTFSDQQYSAISAPLEPAVVIAGAGSGKTTVMAARVVWLIANGLVAPDQILGLTFTTKAAAELASGIRAAMRSSGLLPEPSPAAAPLDPDEVLEPTVATYNAYAATLLTEQGLRIGHEPDARVLADASRYQLAARAIARYTGSVRLLSDHPATVINYVLSLDAAMSEHLVGPDDVRLLQDRERPGFEKAAEAARTGRGKIEDVLNVFDRRDELLGIVEAYRDLKGRLGLIDFSDQIALSARLADEHADVGEAERAKFSVVLLDEYQDTSVAQARLLRRLFSGETARTGRGHTVMAVGDPNQAIYGWRGASVSNILGFVSDFPRADGTAGPAYSLTVNRRSDQRILRVANLLSEPLQRAAALVEPLSARSDAAEGQVRTAVLPTYSAELGWLPDQVKQAYAEVSGRRWSQIGVLTRDNAHAADVFNALSDAEIPVEIVGLQGLLRLPEVAEVVATLTLLHDLTANAELLLLVASPRWNIGARDLALLGSRAAELAGGRGRARQPPGGLSIRDELAMVVVGADPTEIASLSDALDDPGGGAYSAEAHERFALLSAELRRIRRHVGEPLIDLVRRIIDTTGIDVELASSVSPAARARRDNLDLFVKAVAEFQAVDGDVTLPALLAYLEAEDEFGTGLDIATPTEADSVKLLTVHRAKGLEWDAVFIVGVADEKFPIARTRTKWTSGPGVLPNPLRGDRADQPELTGHDAGALDAFNDETKQHQSVEERRLGYVALTRARHLLVVSSYVWSTRQTPLGPSAYQEVVRDAMAEWGDQPDSWIDKPEKGTANPVLEFADERPWPVEAHRAEIDRRTRAAAEVMRAMAEPHAYRASAPELSPPEADRVSRWDDDIERLLAEARRSQADVVDVPLPGSLSATALGRMRDDPAEFARDLARPMPRPPSPAARFGTRFHAWVEARFGQQQILDPDELPGRADTGIDSDSELAELIERFESGPFADRVPVAIEAPFSVVLSGHVVRGRIDAVYDDGAGGYLIVDWKTGRDESSDPLQLAVYRVAWAELTGTSLDQVSAAFYYVRSGHVVEPPLPDRSGIEAVVDDDGPSRAHTRG